MNPLAYFYSLQFVVLLACAAFYYKAAQMEGSSGLLWSALSVVVFILTWIVLSWGWLGCLLSQVGLFAGITVVRVLRRQGL
ncbi:MAG: hypothetical protein ABSA97_10740 [Verrucomicrobiia bacterium]